MKIFTAAATLAALLATAAHAQTGRPAEAPSDRPTATATATDGDQPGSYARYLMLNGTPRDAAMTAARNIDHPAPSTHFALRGTRVNGGVPPDIQEKSSPGGYNSEVEGRGISSLRR